jgi:hypothetical protein
MRTEQISEHTEINDNRRETWKAYLLQFVEELKNKLSASEKQEIDSAKTAEQLVEYAINFALYDHEKFKKELVDLIKTSYILCGTYIYDHVLEKRLSVDLEDEIVALQKSISDKKTGAVDIEYEVLTGPHTDEVFKYSKRPLWNPAINYKESGEA